jgi:serine protease Do
MTVRVSYDEMTLAGAHVQRFPALKQYFGVDSGLLVLSVVPGTPAADAGLRDGDVIVGAGGKAITSPMDLSRALNAARSRASLTLEIVRQRKRRNIDLTW